jgi:uncharacterized membrane protein
MIKVDGLRHIYSNQLRARNRACFGEAAAIVALWPWLKRSVANAASRPYYRCMRIFAILLLLLASLMPATVAMATTDAATGCTQMAEMSVSALPALKISMSKLPGSPMSVAGCADCCTTIVAPVVPLKLRVAGPAFYDAAVIPSLAGVACNLDPPLPRIAAV